MATKKITLKDKGNNELYPKTAAQLVQVSEEENLVQYLAKIILGTTPVGKVSNKLKLKDTTGATKEFDGSAGVDLSGGVNYAATAGTANVANAIKDTNTGANKTWRDIDEYIGQEIGDASEEIYAAIQKLKDDIAGGSVDITIPSASETIYGVSRLAKLEDVTSQNDSSSNDASVAVTPNTLWRYLQSIKGANSGIASLDVTGKVPPAQLPSYVDDVVEYANFSSFPPTGEGSKIYIDLATNKVYRWGGSTYVEVSSPLAIGETTGTAYDGAKGKANSDAISALQTRVGTAEGGITTINGEITKLKTKDTSHDNSITAINNALYGSGNARKFVTLEEFNPVKLNADDVPDLKTWKNQVSEKTIIDDTLVSVFSAIADGEGNDIASTYAKTTDIKEVDKTTVEGLIGVSGLTYSEDGTVTY